jgi:hypothetical protein
VAAVDAEAERCLEQARADAAEYGLLAARLGLSPAMAVEAFTVCRAPILDAAQRWAAETAAPGRDTSTQLARVSRFFDEALLSMLAAREQAVAGAYR